MNPPNNPHDLDATRRFPVINVSDLVSGDNLHDGPEPTINLTASPQQDMDQAQDENAGSRFFDDNRYELANGSGPHFEESYWQNAPLNSSQSVPSETSLAVSTEGAEVWVGHEDVSDSEYYALHPEERSSIRLGEAKPYVFWYQRKSVWVSTIFCFLLLGFFVGWWLADESSSGGISVTPDPATPSLHRVDLGSSNQLPDLDDVISGATDGLVTVTEPIEETDSSSTDSEGGEPTTTSLDPSTSNTVNRPYEPPTNGSDDKEPNGSSTTTNAPQPAVPNNDKQNSNDQQQDEKPSSAASQLSMHPVPNAPPSSPAIRVLPPEAPPHKQPQNITINRKPTSLSLKIEMSNCSPGEKLSLYMAGTRLQRVSSARCDTGINYTQRDLKPKSVYQAQLRTGDGAVAYAAFIKTS